MSSKEFNFTLCIVYSPRLTSVGKFKTFPIPLSHNLSVNILIDLTLRCFDTVFQRPYFSIALKVDFSLSDRCKIFTSNWLWIEICENVVLSTIDITMTTINKKL